MPRKKIYSDVDDELLNLQQYSYILSLVTTQRALFDKIESSNGQNLKEIMKDIEDLDDKIKIIIRQPDSLNQIIQQLNNLTQYTNNTPTPLNTPKPPKNMKAHNRQYYYNNKFKKKISNDNKISVSFKYEIGKFPIEL